MPCILFFICVTWYHSNLLADIHHSTMRLSTYAYCTWLRFTEWQFYKHFHRNFRMSQHNEARTKWPTFNNLIGDVSKLILLKEQLIISIPSSFKYVPNGPIDYQLALVEAGNYCLSLFSNTNKPLPETMLMQFGGPFHWRLLLAGQATTIFCTCHDRSAVVPCIKFCSGRCVRIEVRVTCISIDFEMGLGMH